MSTSIHSITCSCAFKQEAGSNALVCLAGLESLNAEFIRQGLPQSELLQKLNHIVIIQMKSLSQNGTAHSRSLVLRMSVKLCLLLLFCGWPFRHFCSSIFMPGAASRLSSWFWIVLMRWCARWRYRRWCLGRCEAGAGGSCRV